MSKTENKDKIKWAKLLSRTIGKVELISSTQENAHAKIEQLALWSVWHRGGGGGVKRKEVGHMGYGVLKKVGVVRKGKKATSCG